MTSSQVTHSRFGSFFKQQVAHIETQAESAGLQLVAASEFEKPKGVVEFSTTVSGLLDFSERYRNSLLPEGVRKCSCCLTKKPSQDSDICGSCAKNDAVYRFRKQGGSGITTHLMDESKRNKINNIQSRARIRQYIAQHPMCTAIGIGRALDLPTQVVSSHLKFMRSALDIVAHGQKTGYQYTINPHSGNA